MPPSSTVKAGFSYDWLLGENGWKPGMDENFVQLDTLINATYGWDRKNTVGLNYGYYGGYVRVLGVPTHINSSVIAVPDNATRYIERDQITGTVYATAGNFTVSRIPMAVVVSLNGSIASVSDARISDSGFSSLFGIGDVRRYGAVGDGINNDTAAIQAAYNAVNLLTNKRVVTFEPNATYLTTAAINIGVASNISFYGYGATIKPTTAGQRGITGGGNTDVLFDALNIVGTGFGEGYAFNPSTNIEFRNLRVSGANAQDPTLIGETAGIACYTSTNITIDNCKFDNNGYVVAGVQTIGADILAGGNFGVGDVATGWKITRCTCSSTSVLCNINLFDISHSLIQGNTCSGAIINDGANHFGGYGILLYSTGNNPFSVHNNKVLGNTVINTQGTGIYLQNCSASVVGGNNISFTGSLQDDGSLSVGGVSVSNGHNVSVYGNHFNNVYSSAIVISDGSGYSYGVIAEANVIDTVLPGVGGVLRPAIYIRGPVFHASVINNSIVNFQYCAIGNRDNGVAIAVNAHNKINGNSIIGAKVKGVGGIYSVAGATVFELSQTGILANGDVIVIANVAYTISALAGSGLTCTLSGAPTFGNSVGPVYVGFYRPKLTGTPRGIIMFGPQDLSLTDNHIDNVSLEGIYIADGSGGGSVTSRVKIKGGSVTDHSVSGGANFGVIIVGTDCVVDDVSVHTGILGFGYGGVSISGAGSVARFNNVNPVTTTNYNYAGGAFGYGNLDSGNLSFDRIDARQINTQAAAQATVVLIYSAAMTLSALTGNRATITITDGVAHIINAPTNPTINQRLVFTLRNTSGGAAGVATWNAIFKMAAWVQPGNGFSASIEFEYNGANWVEISRSGVTVPN